MFFSKCTYFIKVFINIFPFSFSQQIASIVEKQDTIIELVTSIKNKQHDNKNEILTQIVAPATVNGTPVNVAQSIAEVISPLTNQLEAMATSIQNLKEAMNQQLSATASQNAPTEIPTYIHDDETTRHVPKEFKFKKSVL